MESSPKGIVFQVGVSLWKVSMDAYHFYPYKMVKTIQHAYSMPYHVTYIMDIHGSYIIYRYIYIDQLPIIIIFHNCHINQSILIELDDGKIYRKTLYLMVKTMVSCRFSLQPIQWHSPIHPPMTAPRPNAWHPCPPARSRWVQWPPGRRSAWLEPRPRRLALATGLAWATGPWQLDPWAIL